MSNQLGSLKKRYRDAYRVARSTNGFGILIRVVGLIVGALFVVVGVMLINDRRGTELLGFIAIGVGIIAGMLAFLLGVLVSAQGQILKATLDAAVNTSPFLSNADRASIMSLPQSDSSEVDRSVKSGSTSKSEAIDNVGFPWKDL